MRGLWMAMALMFWLTAVGGAAPANWSDGEWLENSPRLDCERVACAARCSCRCAPGTTSVLADCRAVGLTTVPNIEDFPQQLTALDLRHNSVTRVDASWLETLGDARVLLAGNPLACDCASRPWLVMLLVLRDHVEDYDKLTCASGGAVRALDLSALCTGAGAGSRVWGAVTAVLASVLILLALALLYRRYRRKIKMYMFLRGWCLKCVREREPDHGAELTHDAFISFSERDERFVVEHLLPRLEQEYSVCWYDYRNNTLPGLIGTLDSTPQLVQGSRRMVIVVSRGFESSSRGMIGFRAAYTSALSEGRVRIVVVLLDDVIAENCPEADLRFVLRTNTCLRWSDPQFWQKLRYALPHYPLRRTSDATPPTNGQHLP